MSNPATTIHAKIYAPFRTYFEGEALSLSALNDTGPFDVLPGHKNFICLLSPGKITVRIPQRPDFEMTITQAMLHVKKDALTIFLDV